MTIDDLIRESVEVIRRYEPPSGYFGCFSGGKDSVLLYRMAALAGVRVRWHYHNTTIDPPELVYFLRKHYPDVIWQRPRYGPLLHRVVTKRLLPTRRFRWCCDEYKEVSCRRDSVMLMGIRADESKARAANWKHHTWHKRRRRWIVNPLYNWATDELWQYLDAEGIATCSLYRQGFTRLGCVGCPLASPKQRRMEFDRWPGFAKAWRFASKRLWERACGTTTSSGMEWGPSAVFESEDEYWEWWLSGTSWPGRDKKKFPQSSVRRRHPKPTLQIYRLF